MDAELDLLIVLCFALAPASFDESGHTTSKQTVWRSEQSECLTIRI